MQDLPPTPSIAQSFALAPETETTELVSSTNTPTLLLAKTTKSTFTETNDIHLSCSDITLLLDNPTPIDTNEHSH
ncbi:5829_t:CDS:1, partial [Dentiscutata heterogama]